MSQVSTLSPAAVAPDRSWAPRAPWGPEGLRDGAWRRVLVYGLGLSGRAAAALLLRHGVTVIGADDKPASVDLGDLTGRLSLHTGNELPADLDGVVVSPGVDPEKPLLVAARRAGLPVIGEIELAFAFTDGPIAAITGSNGKSTTTAMAGAMLRAAGQVVEVCGNIGQPLAAVAEGSPGRSFVVELSSFQLETIVHFRPRAAALLNLAPDHLDRYDDLADYGAAKRRIFEHQEPSDVAVLNADDAWTRALAPTARRRFFSRRRPVADGCHVDGEWVIETAPGAAPRELFRVDDVPLAGVHNLENAMAAALLALALGAQPEHLRQALATFQGLPHRLEKVGEAGGVIWFDDSKGTNPAATVKSLEGFADGSVHLILGGRNKGADPAELVPMVTAKVKRVYLIGEAAEELAAALGPRVPAERSETLARAVAAAAGAARVGEVVVLSPACASFDQFRNFVDRGQQFQRLVRETLGGGADG